MALWRALVWFQRASRPHHHFKRLAIVHVAVTSGNTVEVHDGIEDASGMDASFQNIRQQLRDIGPHWRRSTAHRDVVVEGRPRSRHGRILGYTHAADGSAWTTDLDGRFHGLTQSDTFQYRVSTVPAGELAHALYGIRPTFAHHVGRTKLAGESDSCWMAPQEDDALRFEALRRDHATEADRPIAHHGNGLARTDPGDDCRVMARAHDVR